VDFRLNDVEASSLEQPPELVKARALFLSAGEVDGRQAVELGQPFEVVARQRLLEEVDAEALELARGVDRALEAPGHATGGRHTDAEARLVRVGRDDELGSARLAYSLNLRDVFLDGWIVRLQLDRAPALALEAQRRLRPLRGGTEPEHARVG